MIGSASSRDHIAGALTAITGVGAAYQGYQYDIGTVSEMGPGFFPFALGCILMVLGTLIAMAKPGAADASGSVVASLDYRGAACIVGSIVVFVIVVQHGGMLPAAFLATVLAAAGDRSAKPFGTFMLGVVAVIIGFVLFHSILKLPLPLFSWG